MSESVTGNVKGLSLLVQEQGAVVQAAALAQSPPVILPLGNSSPLRMLFRAFGTVGLWLQGLVLGVLAASRLNSSSGTDVDTFVSQFSLTRLLGAYAQGTVTIGRYSYTTSTAKVLPGLLLTSGDGTQQFTVVADPSQPTWNPGLNAYLMPVNTGTAVVSVIANTIGAVGNVNVGAIAYISGNAPGLDYVSNPSALTGGADGESDPALKARFPLYIASLPRSTLAAIQFAVQSVQVGLTYNVIANYNYAGAWTPGYLTIVIDDGSGSPPTALKNAVGAAVELYRAASINYGVFGPTIVTIPASLIITTASGFVHATVVGQVANAITAYMKALTFGQTMPFGALYQIAMNTPGVTDVASVTLNSLSITDATATGIQEIRPGAITVS